MEYRMEHDTMGEVAVPAEHHWGAQTQRSRENFKIGGQRQPKEIITAFAYLKDACAQVNAAEGRITPEQAQAVSAVCRERCRNQISSSNILVVQLTACCGYFKGVMSCIVSSTITNGEESVII